MTIELTDTDRRADLLRALGDGPVHVPGDPGYDAARMPWNVAVDQRPAAVAHPRTVAEVQAVVRAAGALDLRVAPQSTGHNAGPLAAQGLDDVVLLRTSAMTGVTIDPVRRIARVEGGALWEHATAPAGEHGLAALHGSSPDVGIAGYSLGGGIGWYARRLGLATNSLTAVELVTADGEHVRADAHRNKELFWALRGGGGSFGVVTALEFRLYAIESAYAGMLIWDRAHAEPVLRRWAQWAPGAADDVTTSFRVLNLPPLPDIPEMLRGRTVVVIDGAVLGSDTRGEAALAGLRALRPEIDTFGRVPASSLVRLHMDPEGPTPFVSDSAMLDALPEEAIDAFLGRSARARGRPCSWPSCGSWAAPSGRDHEGGGALKRLDATFALFGGAVAATPEMGAQGEQDSQRLAAVIAPWANGRNYLNFAERPVDPRTGYDERTWLQLKGIRSAVDPNGLFVGNHRIPRLFENGRVTD